MIGEYVKLSNGDYGFVAEQRGDMLLVFGDWDVALPCAVRACDVTPADDDAWQSALKTLLEEGAKNLANPEESLRKLARNILKVVHHVNDSRAVAMTNPSLIRMHNALKSTAICTEYVGTVEYLADCVELLAAKATANEVHSEHAQADLNAEGSALDKALAEVEELRSSLALVTLERDEEHEKWSVAYRRAAALAQLMRREAPATSEDCASLAATCSNDSDITALREFLITMEEARQSTMKPLRDRAAEFERQLYAIRTNLDLHEQWERDIRTLVLKHTYLVDGNHSHAHLVEQAFEVMDSRLDSLRDIMNGKLDSANAEIQRLREQVKDDPKAYLDRAWSKESRSPAPEYIAEEPECAHPTDPAPAPHDDEQDADEAPTSSKVEAATDDDDDFAAHVEITGGAYKGQKAHVRAAVKGNKLRVRLDESGREDLVMRDDVRVIDGVLPEPVASTPRTKREPVVVTPGDLEAVLMVVQAQPGLRSDIAARAGISDDVATQALDALFVAGKVLKPDARGKGALWKPAPVESTPIEPATVEPDAVQASLF